MMPKPSQKESTQPPFLPRSQWRPNEIDLATAIKEWIKQNPETIRARALHKLLKARFGNAGAL